MENAPNNKKESHLKNFFKDKLNILAILIITFAILIRLYYLFMAANQPLWWDEAELMLQAKHIAFNTPDTGLFPYREPLLPLFWALLFKIGANEFIIRFFQFIFSITAVFFTYLLSKEIFDKKTALISTAFLSLFYLHIFYSLRFMSESPTLAFVTMGIYFFWKGYISKKSYKYLIFSGAAISIGFLMYYAVAFMGLIIGLFLLITERLKMLKSKHFWVWISTMFILVIPYIINSLITLGTPLPRLSAVGMGFNLAQTTQISAWNTYLTLFPTYLGIVLLPIFLIGFLYYLFNLAIGFDILLKENHQELKKEFFLFLWMIIPIIILTYVAIKTAGHGEDRYLILIFPAVFLISAKFILKMFEYLNKIKPWIGILFVTLLLTSVLYLQFLQNDSLVKNKLASYNQVQTAGLWIKQHSYPSETVFSNSIPQNTYYSERATYFDPNDPGKKISEYKPKYLVWSIFEASGNPNSEFSKYLMANQNSLKIMNGYFADAAQQQPLLYIFQTNFTS